MERIGSIKPFISANQHVVEQNKIYLETETILGPSQNLFTFKYLYFQSKIQLLNDFGL